MKVEINNNHYEIVEVPSVVLMTIYKKEFPMGDATLLFGYCSYVEHVIYINNEICEEQKYHVLKHELTHCWLHHTANGNQSNYTEEYVCDIVSCIYDWLESVIKKLKGEVK